MFEYVSQCVCIRPTDQGANSIDPLQLPHTSGQDTHCSHQKPINLEASQSGPRPEAAPEARRLIKAHTAHCQTNQPLADRDTDHYHNTGYLYLSNCDNTIEQDLPEVKEYY